MKVITEDNFRKRVEAIMLKVPSGKVTTYGDVAAMSGQARASRIVGGIAHYGNSNIPWHRLVNRFGGLASGFPGGRDVQSKLLEYDGVSCTDYIVDNFKDKRWSPDL